MKEDFCIECRKNREYKIIKTPYRKKIRGKTYKFSLSSAICQYCGAEMDVDGIIDLKIKEYDEQYRQFENLVSIDEIKTLFNLYNIGQAPLSLALGFGEVTISRYLIGCFPSKTHSNVIRTALQSPSFMKSQLEKNKSKLTNAAYRKAYHTACEMEKIFSFSDQLRSTIARLFNNLSEITPLALQKLLYFCQGYSLAIGSDPIFPEDCEAWPHGPVYKEIYHLFKSFKYNPIDDDRFIILNNSADALTDKEKQIIDLVSATFGAYSGKTLETITHSEDPWKQTPLNSIIKKSLIKKYYKSVNQEYDLSTEAGTNKYIASKLKAKSLSFISPK